MFGRNEKYVQNSSLISARKKLLVSSRLELEVSIKTDLKEYG
jgi:hypothetical protein